MPCESERRRYTAAVNRAQLLSEELQNAPPPRKPAIVKKIDAHNLVLDAATAALRECEARHAQPVFATGATLNIDFESNDTRAQFHQPGVRREIRFVGAGATRRFSIDDIKVQRTATFTIRRLVGSWSTADGAMTLTGNVLVDMGVFYQATIDVTLDSASTISTPSAVGEPLTSNTFRLVGASVWVNPKNPNEKLDYGVSITATLDIAPR